MSLNPLIIDAEQKAALVALRELAAKHPVDIRALSVLLKSTKGKKAHMKQMNSQTIAIPMNYFVTLSVELNQPPGTCRHLSVSSGRLGMVPSPEAVEMIAAELGFEGGLKNCAVWMEDLSDGGAAVNVVQPVDMPAVGHA
jgi:hypothetical protein